MKKILLLACFFTVLHIADAQAQGGDPAAREARMKEMKTQLIEKAKITEAEADKVMEIVRGNREQMMGLRDLSEADRAKKLDEISAENEKKYKAIPLTDEQVKAVSEYFAERRKNMQRPNRN
ncbi:MAG TPA: hypothetical protein VHK69_22210 [Chitinophagaceae bacterium]|jgi:hypothetical protein|nr:hypothetical protein [Chitinophagaceae bacterium]